MVKDSQVPQVTYIQIFVKIFKIVHNFAPPFQ